MLTIEDVEDAASSLPRSSESEWLVKELVGGRLYVARSGAGSIVLFLLGDEASFGKHLGRQSLEFCQGIQVVSSGRDVDGARISFDGVDQASRAACHIAVELASALGAAPNQTNEEAMNRVAWLIDIIEATWSSLSAEKAKGIVGECILLRRLIQECERAQVPVLRALDTWHGPSAAKRDVGGNGVAIEVKATSQAERRHRIGSLDQLATHGSEDVYLLSIGIREDPTGPRPLSAYVTDVRNLLLQSQPSDAAGLVQQFEQKLMDAGYDSTLEASYDRAHRYLAPHLEPRLYRVADLAPLTASNFAGGAPPSHVTSISYDLTVVGKPLASLEERAVYQKLLGI